MKSADPSLTILYVIEPQETESDAAGDSMLRDLRELCFRDSRIAVQVFDLRETDGNAVRPECSGGITYHGAFGKNTAACFNEGISAGANREWIQFLRSGVFYDVNEIHHILEEAVRRGVKAVSLSPVQSTGSREQSGLLYKERDCVIDLDARSPQYWNFHLDSYFFHTVLIDDLRFDEKLPEEEAEQMFLLEVMGKCGSYFLHPQTCRINRFLITDADSYRPAFSKNWYTPSLQKVYLPLLQAHPSSRLYQSGILYLIRRRMYANRNNWNKDVLQGEALQEFNRVLAELLQQIDDCMLAEWDETSTAYDRVLALHLLKMKYGGEPCEPVIMEEGEVRACPGEADLVLADVSEITFQVDAINYTENGLLIDGEVKNVPWAEHGKLEAGAWCGEHRIDAVRTDICRFEKLFGRSIWRAYMVRIRIPEEWLDGSDIRFTVTYRGMEYPCRNLLFARIQARLHHRYKNSYWVFGRHILFRRPAQPQTLAVEACSLASKLRRERKLLREIKDPSLRRLRILYHLTAPLYRGKRIWITYDQLFKGGDNGEYFYRYVTEHHGRDVQMYYLVNEDFSGFDTREHKGRLLFANSSDRNKRMKTWLTALHADIIFSTRASVDSFFDLHRTGIRAAVCDLYQPNIVCLQHGLTVQKIAQYQNRIQDNIRHYFCASPFEGELLCRPVFGYGEDMISITGSPRYDGLTGTAKKQILICPTWRRNVTDGLNEKGKQYGYNPAFQDSAFFRIYQRLIRDPRLIASAKEHGYRILLVLHPNIGSQARDFLHDDTVQVISGVDVDYESLMGASQLMVTDYSGVRFDFAYMRRPLIYYRPEELPPQYEEGVRFEDMQFGPVCSRHEEAVENLCRMMENDCRLENEYRARIDRFFPYSDQKNCERVFEAAWKFQTQTIDRTR